MEHLQPLTLHLTSDTCSFGIFQRLSRTCKMKNKELIPKRCQQIQIDSIPVTFEPIHPICLEKKGHTKASLTSQDNSDSSMAMEIFEKNWWTQTDFVKLVQYTERVSVLVEKWISAGHGIKFNPATYCHLIHDTSSIIAVVISSMPFCHIFTTMQHVP